MTILRVVKLFEIPAVVAAHYAKKGLPSPLIDPTLPREQRFAAMARRLQDQTARLERLVRRLREL